MNDKELLEWAAKAAGYILKTYHPKTDELEEFFSAYLPVKGKEYLYPEYWSEEYWNPLEDDGDALRLAVKLKLMINCNGASTHVFDGEKDTIEHSRGQGSDAATRRAIVIAAAEIGKQNERP